MGQGQTSPENVVSDLIRSLKRILAFNCWSATGANELGQADSTSTLKQF